ncbi:hypothetical protein HDU84_000148 [Entophlyctis sp. JEL0112]|nr:hypothetical protein HDU84_000148 [Entophlyctis sp. JEL0112]
MDNLSLVNSTISHLESAREMQEEDERTIGRVRALSLTMRAALLTVQTANLVKKESKNILASCESLPSSEEQLRLMHTKYLDMFKSNKRMEREAARAAKRRESELFEKETMVADLNRLGIQKQKVENLCRELQRENKRIQEKLDLMVHNQKLDREAFSSNFVRAVSEFAMNNGGMQSEKTSSKQHIPKNNGGSSQQPFQSGYQNSEPISERLMNFFTQWSLREKQFEAMTQANDVNSRLLQSKLEMQRQLATQESERVSSLRAQVASFLGTERDLRRQLQVYVEKFRQVEDTLNKSNELFSTFRIEMEAMTSKTKRLEADNLNLKSRLETLNTKVAQFVQDRKSSDIQKYARDKLESLCRVRCSLSLFFHFITSKRQVLQAERNQLRKQVVFCQEELESVRKALHEVSAQRSNPGSAGANELH